MSRRRRGGLSESRPSFGLSFVDVVSGGFGAAFFLFLIFASLPIDDAGRQSGGGSRFLEIWLSWSNQNTLAEIRLRHSDAGEIRLTGGLNTEDPSTVILTTGTNGASFWRSGSASGFSWFGETVMSTGAAPHLERAVRFRFVDICGGVLEIDANVHGRTEGAFWLREAPVGETLASLKVILSTGEGAKKLLFKQDMPLSRGYQQFVPIALTEEESGVAGTQISLGETPEDYSWCSI